MTKTSEGMILYASHGDSTDTITIQRKQASPAIYEILRSNPFDSESGNFFIDAEDSAKVEHVGWDCDEYQG